jgi:signal transduction histidine kinase
VKISARLEAEQLIFQVIDNGPGIPIQEQPYIFDRFYRAANSEETTGTGLGLAIVKSIVENNQGRVWVESQPGHGTTFTVVMPVLQQETRPVAAD